MGWDGAGEGDVGLGVGGGGGADVVGLNCSVGPSAMLNAADRLLGSTDRPVSRENPRSPVTALSSRLSGLARDHEQSQAVLAIPDS